MVLCITYAGVTARSTPPTLVFTHRASSGSQDYWLSICTADQMASYSDFDRQVWLQ